MLPLNIILGDLLLSFDECFSKSIYIWVVVESFFFNFIYLLIMQLNKTTHAHTHTCSRTFFYALVLRIRLLRHYV